MSVLRNREQKRIKGVLCSLLSLYEAKLLAVFYENTKFVRQNDQNPKLNIIIMDSIELQ